MNTPKIVSDWLAWLRAQPPLFVWAPVAIIVALWVLLAVIV